MKKIFTLLMLLSVPFFLSIPANAEEPVMSEPTVVFETNQGNIELQLFCDVAPKTCENFIGLVKQRLDWE